MKKIIIFLVMSIFVFSSFYFIIPYQKLYEKTIFSKAIQRPLITSPTEKGTINLGYAKINENNEITFLHKDYLGSNRIGTNENGEVVFSYDAYPFGATLKQIGENKFSFTEKEKDTSTGLFYFGARYYDPETGRFFSLDPIGRRDYVYVHNNPLNLVDKLGMEATDPEELDLGRWTHPAMEHLGKKYVSGGTLNLGHLDKSWYEAMIPAAVERGIDPYYFLAVSILEYGGVRTVTQEIAPDLVSQKFLGILGTGMKYIRAAGATGLLARDAWAAGTLNFADKTGATEAVLISAETPWLEKKLREINDGTIYLEQTQQEARDPYSPLNQQSFILLKRQQQRALHAEDIYIGLQGLVGYGRLGRLSEEGKYPELVWDANTYTSKVTGKELPINGRAIGNLMGYIYQNPEVRAMVGDAETPVMDRLK